MKLDLLKKCYRIKQKLYKERSEKMEYKSKIIGGDKSGAKRSQYVRIPRLIADDAKIGYGDIVMVRYEPKKKQIIINLKGE